MSNARVFNKVREIQRKEINKIISNRSELELLARNRMHRIIFFPPLSCTWQLRRWDRTYKTQISKMLSSLRVAGKTFSLWIVRTKTSSVAVMAVKLQIVCLQVTVPRRVACGYQNCYIHCLPWRLHHVTIQTQTR